MCTWPEVGGHVHADAKTQWFLSKVHMLDEAKDGKPRVGFDVPLYDSIEFYPALSSLGLGTFIYLEAFSH